MDGKRARPSIGADERIARIAARQHGVVSAAQLHSAGIGRGAIEARLARGSLRPVHRGVYAVGHDGLSRDGVFMAAVLACGDGAVLSHFSAAVLWGLLRHEADRRVEVSVPGYGGRRRRSGIWLHRTATLVRSDLTMREQIPVTTPSRTILDLRASKLEPHLLRRAIREAERPKYKLDLSIPTDRTRSDLEHDFLALCRRHRLPPPEVNVRLAPRLEVDFLWRSHNLVVETDSYEYHGGQIAFEDDRKRDFRLRRRGLTVLRYTGAQLRTHGALIAAEIAALLPSFSSR